MSQSRVVITGLGLITPAGLGWQPYWEAVLRSHSFLSDISQITTNGFPAKLAGQIKDFHPADFVSKRKQLKVMSREIQLAVAASQLALQDAGFRPGEGDPFRFGVSLGTGVINTDLDELGVGLRHGASPDGKFNMAKFGQDGVRSLFPLWFLKYLPNMPACHVSMIHGFKGPSNTITTSSAAGTQAIGEAVGVIRRGDADLVLAGGTDSKINAMGMARFNLLGLLSHRSQYPEKAYCPFDIKHDGIFLGEGAGLLVLEERQHALKRGAHIYGEILGYGSSSDFNYDPRRTEDYTGKRLAMMRAMDTAGRGPGEIDFLLANGSGIPQEDDCEAMAVRSLFESKLGGLRVTGVKPITGHGVYASGGIEVAAGLLSLQEGVIPPLANLEKPAPVCDLPFVRTEGESSASRTFLFNSFGFGGQNASLVVAR